MRILSSIIIVVSMAFLFSCGGSSSPKDTVKNFLESIKIGEIEKSKAFFHPDTAERDIKKFTSVYDSWHKALKNVKNYSMEEEDLDKEKGQARYEIMHDSFKSIIGRNIRVKLKKHNGDWLVLMDL